MFIHLYHILSGEVPGPDNFHRYTTHVCIVQWNKAIEYSCRCSIKAVQSGWHYTPHFGDFRTRIPLGLAATSYSPQSLASCNRCNRPTSWDITIPNHNHKFLPHYLSACWLPTLFTSDERYLMPWLGSMYSNLLASTFTNLKSYLRDWYRKNANLWIIGVRKSIFYWLRIKRTPITKCR